MLLSTVWPHYRSRGRFEQSFNRLIVENRQAVQSVDRSMDWTLEDNTHRSQSMPYPICAGRSVSFDLGAEAFKPDPSCSWKGNSRRRLLVSRMKVRSLAGLSNHSAFHR